MEGVSYPPSHSSDSCSEHENMPMAKAIWGISGITTLGLTAAIFANNVFIAVLFLQNYYGKVRRFLINIKK